MVFSKVLLHYLMNYPLGKNLKKNLQFYIDHLEYEMDDGRRSAVEMMIAMFAAFPSVSKHDNLLP